MRFRHPAVETRGEGLLQRLFSTFPGGWPGLGLLLLRLAVGCTAVVTGVQRLVPSGSSDLRVVGVLMLAGGVLILAGFLTPVAAGTIAVAQAAAALGWIATTSGGAPELQSAILPALVSASVVLLGPGAFALDARLFGRREIVIPHEPRSPRS